MNNNPTAAEGSTKKVMRCWPSSSPSCIDAAIQTGLLASCSWRSFIFLMSSSRTLRSPTAKF